jgi:hypothetical protein
VTLTNFPPGPAHVDVRLANSTYVRQVDVPDGREIAVAIPDGLLSVHVVDAITTKPIAGAAIAWTSGGARVEATATVTGDALLEGVGASKGTLAASAPGYQAAEEPLAEPPGLPHTIALAPTPARPSVRCRVITASGDPVPNAVVELTAPDVPRVAATDANGVVTFSDVPSGPLQLAASADGFAPSSARVGKDGTSEMVLRAAAK